MSALVESHATVNRRTRLSAAQERDLVHRWQHGGDRDARDTLVECTLPLVRHIARSYADRGESLEDLIQVGSIGLVLAIDRFDLDRGLRLSTFAAPTISGEIKRHFRDRTWSVRTPRSLKEAYAVLRLARERFTDEHGRSPNVAELVDLTQYSESEVLDALDAGRNYVAASLDAPVVGDLGARAVIDGVAAHDESFDRADDRMFVEAGLMSLPIRERRVLLMRFSEGLTQSEIAERVGLSQMHISRLLTSSLRTLRGELA